MGFFLNSWDFMRFCRMLMCISWDFHWISWDQMGSLGRYAYKPSSGPICRIDICSEYSLWEFSIKPNWPCPRLFGKISLEIIVFFENEHVEKNGINQQDYPLVIWHNYWKWPMYTWFAHEKRWFYIAMLVYQMVLGYGYNKTQAT